MYGYLSCEKCLAEVLEVVVGRELGERQQGLMRISILYRIKATQLTQSFVYPFYLEPRPV